MSPEDQQYLDDNAHVPSAEIRQDIHDTEDEIAQYKRGMQHADPKMHSGYQRNIDDRQKFVDDLKRLLKLRGEAQ